jgi:UDP-glucose 4-epimerase
VTTTLITGLAGGLAQRTADVLVRAGENVVGVDYRPVGPLPPSLADIPVYRANYNKTAIEDVFRHHSFDRVLHLGRVGNLKEEMGKRFDLNVVGSQKIMDLCLQHHVRKLVVLSTFHIYGAHPHNHILIAEDEPLRAGADFPQLADAIQLDNMASTWIYRHREIPIVVLRPTNVIGPSIRNTLSNFLRLPTIPRIAGFDPMIQFIHEDDLAEAILIAAEGDRTGVYNLAGRDAIPWSEAAELSGARTVPIPSTMATVLLPAFAALPAYLVNFFKYPCIISDRTFRETFAWEPKLPLREALRTTVAEARSAQKGSQGRGFLGLF